MEVGADGRQHLGRRARAGDPARGVARERELEHERQQDDARDRDEAEADPDDQISSHDLCRETAPRRESDSPIRTNPNTIRTTQASGTMQEVRRVVDRTLPLGEHVAPLRGRRLDAGAEVAEARPDRDDRRAVEGRDGRDQAGEVREDVPPDHRPTRRAHRDRGLDECPPAQRERLAEHDPRRPRPVERRHDDGDARARPSRGRRQREARDHGRHGQEHVCDAASARARPSPGRSRRPGRRSRRCRPTSVQLSEATVCRPARNALTGRRYPRAVRGDVRARGQPCVPTGGPTSSATPVRASTATTPTATATIGRASRAATTRSAGLVGRLAVAAEAPAALEAPATLEAALPPDGEERRHRAEQAEQALADGPALVDPEQDRDEAERDEDDAVHEPEDPDPEARSCA